MYDWESKSNSVSAETDAGMARNEAMMLRAHIQMRILRVTSRAKFQFPFHPTMTFSTPSQARTLLSPQSLWYKPFSHPFLLLPLLPLSQAFSRLSCCSFFLSFPCCYCMFEFRQGRLLCRLIYYPFSLPTLLCLLPPLSALLSILLSLSSLCPTNERFFLPTLLLTSFLPSFLPSFHAAQTCFPPSEPRDLENGARSLQAFAFLDLRKGYTSK